MKYLIVVAHPDDEVIGCGASIKKWASNGDEVDICIMSTEAKARAFRPKDEQLNDDLNSSSDFLGISNKYVATFPNIEMNTVPHIRLVQFIESAISESKPDVIITHHPSDTNNDHLQTSLACQEAIRLFQRRTDVSPIKEFWFMEIQSSTDWSVNTAMNRFKPNTWVEIGKDGIEDKIKALNMYRGVMRPFPHPRSIESLTGLAAYRGGQVGYVYAEAYECVFRRYSDL